MAATLNCDACGEPLPDLVDHPDAPWTVQNGVGGEVMRFHDAVCLKMYGRIYSGETDA